MHEQSKLARGYSEVLISSLYVHRGNVCYDSGQFFCIKLKSVVSKRLWNEDHVLVSYVSIHYPCKDMMTYFHARLKIYFLYFLSCKTHINLNYMILCDENHFRNY